ncbi:MAG: radical SAM protein, partial [Bradymonadia bacterium]
LWFNTGTLCNLTCENCYIESSPTNDALVFLTLEDVATYLMEIQDAGLPTKEIGFTGGEPFVNPQMNALIEMTLEAGFETLVLTNAMRPMQRQTVAEELLRLSERFGTALTLRVSLDHYTSLLHEKERGIGSWSPTMKGIQWLFDNGVQTHIAGRTCWGESVDEARQGYDDLFRRYGWPIDAFKQNELVLFPEMEMKTDLPEISTACWSILNKKPSDMMCATSRMVVKRRGRDRPSVVACTLLPYEAEFELGATLDAASSSVALNHPHCARFCVLGGASCSG